MPARKAYRFLVDGKALGRWALGAFDTRRAGPNLWRGTSLFDGRALFVRPVGDARRLIVDYHVGSDRKKLVPRIMARVAPTTKGNSIIILVAWRDAGMDDERWTRLQACHEVEVRLIQSLLA